MPTTLPTLVTGRLILRAFDPCDAQRVQELAGDWEIADKTLRVPHPYEAGMAEEWIATHQPGFEDDELLALAITHAEDEILIGAIGLALTMDHGRGHLGYWIGRPYWGQGFCTEAARAIVAYGFDALNLNKIESECLLRNPASARVLVKTGLTLEGRKRGHYKKWGKFEDIEQYGLLRSESGLTGKGSQPVQVRSNE